MAAEDVALALMMLSNERAHWEVSHGEFGRFEGFRLSDEERELLVASTWGVERRDEKVPVAFRPDDSIVELMEGPGGPERGFGYWPPGTAEAIRYAQAGLEDPRMQASFIAWQEIAMDILP
jgi:hypothetical protein